MPPDRTRIFVRPLASALPTGLLVFGIGMLLLGAFSLGWIKHAEGAEVGVLLVAFVFPAELVAGVFAFLLRDTLAATALTVYATSWLALGLVMLAFPPGTTHALGFYLLAFAAAIYALVPAALPGKRLLALILAVSATRALLQGIYEFSTSKSVDHAAGICALALTALAVYAGLALLLEDTFGRAVLPVLRRGAARDAVAGPLEDQLRAAESEPGVRQQM